MQSVRIALLWSCSIVVFGQDAAWLSGTVVDPSNAVVPDAEVSLLAIHRGTIVNTVTDVSGFYLFNFLIPGQYTLEVRKDGFSKLRIENLRLNVRDRKSMRLQLEIAPVDPTVVTVTAGAEGVSADPSGGAAIEHEFAENLPTNRRNVQSLVLMSPGVISSGGGDQINVNGLRSNTNYYMIDGVSSLGGGLGGGGGPGPGGPRGGGGFGPGGGGMANPANAMPLDAMEEVRVQTSTFAPEFGRSPGAQISISSRSGGNEFHGSAYGYVRNDRFNANDWFANANSLPRGKMRHSNYGGTFGGPVVRNRTYFFVSYEGLRSETPETSIADVPDLATRAATPESLTPFVNAFPVPNGSDLEDGAAQFVAVYGNHTDTDTASLRLDQGLGNTLSMFARYSYDAGQRDFRQRTAPSVVSASDSKSHLFTASLIWLPDPFTTNDLRFNVSMSNSRSNSTMDDYGGAVPLTDDLVFPDGITSNEGSFSFNIAGFGGYSYGAQSRNKQHQINIVDHLTSVRGNHTLKGGFDYRRQAPTNFNKPYTVTATFNGLLPEEEEDGSLLSGTATTAVVRSNETSVYPLFTNVSLYGQDTWKATDRTTVTFGLRWDINPAPEVRSGPPPIALLGSTQAPAITRFSPIYKTRWGDIAPRIGLAYQMDTKPGREMMFRAGLGVFYDIGYGSTASAFNGSPYSSDRILTSTPFPLSGEDLTPPTLPASRPFGQVTAADPNLKSPKVYQWSATVERMFGTGQSLSIGYVGTQGRELLQIEGRPSFSDDYDLLSITTNGATSDYHGLQVQFRRRFARRFTTQLSYTYGHSIDSASNDMGRAGFARILGSERGDSNFDIRHNVSFSGNFNLPAPQVPIAAQLLRDWNFDWIVTARTASPFNIQGISEAASEEEEDDDEDGPRGLFAQVRPNYTGEPIWIADANAPGGRRLNPDAFELPDEYEQGNLGRNVIRGFQLFQVDFALRRQIGITERVRLQVAAQAFNALNNPNFSNPTPFEGANMSSPSFGISTSMLGQSQFGGTSSLYRTGGPRSMQLSLRIQF